MLTINTWFGILFIIYGLLKMAAFFAIYLIPDRLQTIAGLNLIISGDHTMAGRAVEWVLAVFALFSIVHGSALIGMFPHYVDSLIESRAFQYSFYTVCGAALIVFYSLVLYSDAPISKKKENYKMYWIYGYLIGLSFLIVPILWHVLIAIYPMPVRDQFTYLTVSLLVFFAAATVIYGFYSKQST
jgi:hypothetical protein